jgi:hypothetical protein
LFANTARFNHQVIHGCKLRTIPGLVP